MRCCSRTHRSSHNSSGVGGFGRLRARGERAKERAKQRHGAFPVGFDLCCVVPPSFEPQKCGDHAPPRTRALGVCARSRRPAWHRSRFWRAAATTRPLTRPQRRSSSRCSPPSSRPPRSALAMPPRSRSRSRIRAARPSTTWPSRSPGFTTRGSPHGPTPTRMRFRRARAIPELAASPGLVPGRRPQQHAAGRWRHLGCGPARSRTHTKTFTWTLTALTTGRHHAAVRGDGRPDRCAGQEDLRHGPQRHRPGDDPQALTPARRRRFCRADAYGCRGAPASHRRLAPGPLPARGADCSMPRRPAWRPHCGDRRGAAGCRCGRRRCV